MSLPVSQHGVAKTAHRWAIKTCPLVLTYGNGHGLAVSMIRVAETHGEGGELELGLDLHVFSPAHEKELTSTNWK